MAVPAGRHPVLWVDKAAIVSAPAEIDPASADDILVCLLSVIRQGATVLIVDMHTTRFCDPAGVSRLVRAFRHARASGVEMRLAVSDPAVRHVLGITGADRVIGTYPTVPLSLMGGPAPPGGPDHP
jgi:anti-sigma B factor antagonist